MIARAEWANGWGGLQAQMLHIAQGNAPGGAYALIKVSRPEMSCKRGQSSLLGLPSAADIMKRATCFMRGNAPWHCEFVWVTRFWRVAFLRRWHKNAECINRGVRYPGRCPGLRAATGLTARPNHLPFL